MNKYAIPIMILLLSLSFLSSSPQNAYDIFQKALAKERAEGKLEEAIELYKKILEQFPQNREIGAKALYRVGLCYEKLGKQEAQKAYQRIISEYADQQEVVKNARERLASLASVSKDLGQATAAVESEGMTIKKIDIDEIGKTHQVALSPDGTKILYIHVQDKKPQYSIRVMDLSSGHSKTLVEGIEWGHYVVFEWSPDGKKVVYKHQEHGLCVIDADGGRPEVICPYPNKDTPICPLDWSLDNRHILAVIDNQAEATLSLVTLPAQGGEPHTIVSGNEKELGESARFSPNGEYVVGFKTKESNTDVYIWPVEGGQEIRVTNHPAEDQYPFWSSDGKYIVFVSDRAKAKDIWAIPMKGPNPAGAPIRIRRNLGKNTMLMDLTPGGKLTLIAYTSEGIPPDLLVLPLEPVTEETLGQFRPFAKYPTQHFLLRWSPDGTRVAYTSRKGNFQLPNIYVSSGNEKEDLEIPVGNYFVNGVEWGRDGDHLIFPGALQPDGHIGIFRVSLDDHQIEPLHLGKRQGSSFKGMFLNLWWLSRAGKFFFEKYVDTNEREFYTMDKEGKNVQLVANKIIPDIWTWPSPDVRHIAYREGQNLKLLSLADNTSMILAQFPEGEHIEGLAWSPDGQNLAWNDSKQFKVFSVSEGEFRTLVEAQENQKISGLSLSFSSNMAWSPDGKKIAYVLQEALDEPEARTSLWIIPTTGGAPKKIADAPSSHPVIDNVIWHSNGKMVFVTGKSWKQGIWYEYWVMENFLPEMQKR